MRVYPQWLRAEFNNLAKKLLFINDAARDRLLLPPQTATKWLRLAKLRSRLPFAPNLCYFCQPRKSFLQTASWGSITYLQI